MSGDQKIDLVKPDVNKPWCRLCRGHTLYRVVTVTTRTNNGSTRTSIINKCEECESSMLTQEEMRGSITKIGPLLIVIPIIFGILTVIFIPGELPDDIKFALFSGIIISLIIGIFRIWRSYKILSEWNKWAKENGFIEPALDNTIKGKSEKNIPDPFKPWCKVCQGHTKCTLVGVKGQTREFNAEYRCNECGNKKTLVPDHKRSVRNIFGVIAAFIFPTWILFVLYLKNKGGDDYNLNLIAIISVIILFFTSFALLPAYHFSIWKKWAKQNGFSDGKYKEAQAKEWEKFEDKSIGLDDLGEAFDGKNHKK